MQSVLLSFFFAWLNGTTPTPPAETEQSYKVEIASSGACDQGANLEVVVGDYRCRERCDSGRMACLNSCFMTGGTVDHCRDTCWASYMRCIDVCISSP